MIDRADSSPAALTVDPVGEVGRPRAHRPLSVVVAVGLLVVTALFALPGCAHQVDDEQAVVAPAQQQVGSDEFYKITMTVTNRTNQTLWIKSAELGHEGTDGGAWGDRAVNLGPEDSEAVSAYSAIQGQGIKLVYEDPDQTLSVTLMAQDPAIGKNNDNGTKATSPLTVTSSITDGRQTTATFVITS
jgi:hypothetical protein